MGFLQSLSLVVVLAVASFTLFVRFAMEECKSFSIDDQTGKVVIITGANSGIGYQTSLVLAKAGANVVMGCRSAAKCDQAKSEILASVPNATIDTFDLDLASFKSIRNFADSFKTKYGKVGLDVLINNAGIMANPTREVTVDGLEAQIGTNHFGHFLLTGLLLPVISKRGKIINHSSSAHQFAASTFPFSDIQSENYAPWVAYGNSKIANLFFTFELNKRLQKSGNPKEIVSIAVHPGYTDTNLQRGVVKTYGNLLAMRIEDGSQSQIAAAAKADIAPSLNTYFGPKYQVFGAPVVQATSPASTNADAHAKLWDESVKVTGVDFGGL